MIWTPGIDRTPDWLAEIPISENGPKAAEFPAAATSFADQEPLIKRFLVLLDYVNNGGTLIVQYNVIYGPPLPPLGPVPDHDLSEARLGRRRARDVAEPTSPRVSQAERNHAARLRSLGAGARPLFCLGLGPVLPAGAHTIRTSRRNRAACSTPAMARAFTSSAGTPGSANSPRVSPAHTESLRIC